MTANLISLIGVFGSAIIALAGVIYSSRMSTKIAKESTEKEFEKIYLLWRHEAKVSIEKSVGEVCAYVSIFLWKRDEKSYKEAIVKLNEARAITTGPVASMLDSIFYDIEQRRNETFPIRDDKIRELLAKCIDQCRNDTHEAI